MAKKLKVKRQIRAYDVVARAVEEGASYGVRRSFKHDDDPPDDRKQRIITEHVINAVLSSLCDVLNFDDV